MVDPNTPPSLDDLATRLKKARGEDQQAERPGRQGMEVPGSALGMALRIGVELVVGVVVGVGMGYALDQWLGTTPWLMIVFFILGAAAGMLNVWRVVTGQGLAVGYTRPDGDAERRRDGAGERER